VTRKDKSRGRRPCCSFGIGFLHIKMHPSSSSPLRMNRFQGTEMLSSGRNDLTILYKLLNFYISFQAYGPEHYKEEHRNRGDLLNRSVPKGLAIDIFECYYVQPCRPRHIYFGARDAKRQLGRIPSELYLKKNVYLIDLDTFLF
jgi:hypothetical protein